MKMIRSTLVLSGALMAMPTYDVAQQVDLNMLVMTGTQHDAKAAEVQGRGDVKALDVGGGTITLHHQAITAVG